MSRPALGSEAELSPEASDVPTMAPRLVRGALLALVVSLLVYAGLLLHADLDRLSEELAKLSGPRLALLIAVSSLHVVLRCVRWDFYLRRLGIQLARQESALICIAGFAMSLSPGKLGEVFKSVMLKQASGAPVARTAPIVLIERVTDVAGLVLLCALGLGVAQGAWGVSAMLALGVVSLGALASSRVLATRVVDWISRPARLRRHRAKLGDALDVMSDLMQPRSFVVGTCLSIGAWAAHGVTLALAADAFSGVHLGWLEAQLAYGGPLLAGTLAMLPGGVGLTEATMAGAIVQLAGASLPVATAITLVVRGVTFWLTMLLGALALVAWSARRSVRADRSASS